MRNMVRVAGRHDARGRRGGRRPIDDFRALLEGARASEAGPTASPYGLHLAGVRY